MSLLALIGSFVGAQHVVPGQIRYLKSIVVLVKENKESLNAVHIWTMPNGLKKTSLIAASFWQKESGSHEVVPSAKAVGRTKRG